MEVGKKYFEELIDKMKEDRGIQNDTDLTADDLKELAQQFKAEYKAKLGADFPSDPKDQLMGAIKAVFRSWNNPRAIVYRRLNDIPGSWGTAVTVQEMVFGNLGDTSGTGVAFTRNPATGEKKLFGEFLMNAQGEDVVAGVRTPQTIDQLQAVMPEAYADFVKICATLESHYRDMQDMEFTIEDKKLFMLQTRNGKRTAAAALKIACDLVDEGVINEKEAVLMIDPKSLDALLHPQFEAGALKKAKPIGMGLAASPGAASGKAVFTAEDAKEWASMGEKVILVRLETSPEDIEGMAAAQGILTVRGGMTSHAASSPGAWAPAASRAAAPSRWMKRTRRSRSAAKSTKRATGSASTARRATSTARPSTPRTPQSAASSPASWAGPINTENLTSARTPTPRATPDRRVNSGRRASACAARSTCSLTPTGSPPSAR